MLPRLLRHPSLKDQTYYLASISQLALDRTIFPLGNPPRGGALGKDDVRAIARKWGLHTAGREESMGICFVGEKRRFGEFVCMFRLLFTLRFIFYPSNCHILSYSTIHPSNAWSDHLPFRRRTAWDTSRFMELYRRTGRKDPGVCREDVCRSERRAYGHCMGRTRVRSIFSFSFISIFLSNFQPRGGRSWNSEANDMIRSMTVITLPYSHAH
jgi:tRNA methyl transferase